MSRTARILPLLLAGTFISLPALGQQFQMSTIEPDPGCSSGYRIVAHPEEPWRAGMCMLQVDR